MKRLWFLGAALALAVAGLASTASPALGSPAAPGQSASQRAPRALLVCNGSTVPCPGRSRTATVQGAVDAARPGDWILIWPGVYHEKSTQWPQAGVWIQTPNLHIRGLDRNGVIIDGSNGTASKPVPVQPRAPGHQRRRRPQRHRGVQGQRRHHPEPDRLRLPVAGRRNGNEIWWNGGDGSGKIGMGAYTGSYLSATSMYGPSNVNDPNLAQYGIFVSNARGPGVIDESYASNMADAAYYVGGVPAGSATPRSSTTSARTPTSGTPAPTRAARWSSRTRCSAATAPGSCRTR